jgi:uncharacterized membrane protein YqjE
MEREIGAVMEKLRSSIDEAEKLLTAIAAVQAEQHLTRISAQAATAVRAARARLDDEPQLPDATQQLIAGLLALARTRIELFSVELHSNIARETRAQGGKLAALILGITGAGFAALAVAIAVGDTHRVLAAAISAAIFLLLAAGATWATWRALRQRERLLELSLAELQRDLDALEPSPGASRPD